MKIPKNKTRSRLWLIAVREVRWFGRRPVLFFCTMVAPLLCVWFFTSLMHAGLPKQLPAALVDEDNTHITRIIIRTLSAFEETHFVARYATFSEARKAVQDGKAYAIFHIPKGTTEKALGGRQPRIAFYTNDAYYVPANLLMKDMKTASELVSLALTREKLRARGFTEREALAAIRPIVIETHPLHNAVLDYSVYLTNMLVPGILVLLILLTTVYTLGMEWKRGAQHVLFRLAGHRTALAVVGKLWPQTLVYTVLMVGMDVYFYRWLGFPCNGGIGVMIALSVLTVTASQGMGVFLFGCMAGRMRMAMCVCSLWGILSFSLAGFTYPVTAMSPVLRLLAVLFPLRHYYLIYVNQALNGYSLAYVWPSVAALLVFMLLPLLVRRRYGRAFLQGSYKP